MDTRNYLIIGAGSSGFSVVEYFLAHNKNFRIMDTRELPPNADVIKSSVPEACISFGEIKQQWIDRADIIVLSPGVSPHTPEIQKAHAQGVEVIGDIELFAREVTKPYIAITGSNGKSTVTMLVTQLLKSQGLRAKACGNIGEPALSLIDDDNVDIYVLELSSFQLETCASLAAQAAVVLNVCDDHLDRHQSIDEYAAIKASIYNHATCKIIPRDHSTKRFLSNYRGDISFGLDIPDADNFGVIEDDKGRWLVQGSRKIINTENLPLIGATGQLNVLAALALTHTLINDESKAVEAIQSFRGLPHRCQLIAGSDDVQWIDDSKGTNIGATVSAINGLEREIVLIVGGVHKGGLLDDLVEAVEKKVSHVIVFGQDKQIFVDALNEHVDVRVASSLSECVELASKLVFPGQAVLFSPACASFDMFQNYVERGLAFQAAVKRKVKGEQSDC